MEETKKSGQKKQIIIFLLGDETYGADVKQVREIIRESKITVVPKSPPFILGVIDLRGKIIPVVNLSAKFNLPESTNKEKSRIIITDINGEPIGIKVDAVTEVIKVDAQSIEPAPSIAITEELKKAIPGVIKTENILVSLLDLEKVLPKNDIENKKEAKNG